MADLFATLMEDVASAQTSVPVDMAKVNERVRGGRPAILDIDRDGATGTVAVYGVNVSNPWAGRVGTQVFKGDGTNYQFLSDIAYAAFSNYNWILLLGESDRYVVGQGAAIGFAISNGTGGKARVDFAADSDTGDGSTTAFATTLLYSLLTYCDLVVKVNGVTQAASAYALTNVSGAITCTFTAAPTNTHPITYQLVPKSGVQFGLIFCAPVTVLAAAANQTANKEIKSYDFMWAVTAGGTVNGTDVRVRPY